MDAAESPKKRRILKAIWNGPFYVGPLSSPASVGDVLLKVLETVWRALVAVVSLVLVSAAIVTCWLLVIEPTLFPPLKSSIEASVRYDDGSGPPPIRIAPAGQIRAFDDETFRCNRDFPLLVRFTNQSEDTIGKIRFEIEAYRKGYAEPISSYTPFFESSAIIDPGYWLESCWASPTVPDSLAAHDLIYRVEIFNAEKIDPALAARLAPSISPPSLPAYPVANQTTERSRAAKAAGFVVALFAVAAIVVGALCLTLIMKMFAPSAFKKRIDRSEGIVTLLAGFANLVLVAGLAYIPPFNEWLEGLDRWSRASGYADAASLGVFGLFSIWPLPAFLFLAAKYGNRDKPDQEDSG